MTLKLELDGDTGLVGTRRFAAPPEAVFDAHLDPAILPRWLFGPDGWRMTACESDARPGGRFRFAWEGPDGEGAFSMTGEYLALDRPHRIEHVERMHLAETTPDNRVVTVFEREGSGTRMTITMRVPTSEAREAMVASGMEEGMEASYARLDALETAA